MAKDINFTSQEWNDIIFEGKNKAYGAYEIRRSSSKRHIIAFLISVVVIIFVSFLPMLIESVASMRKISDNISESTVLADLQKELEEQVQEKDIIREETAPPPPPLKSTIQFTAPEIVDASEMTEEDEIKSQDELTDSKVQISVATVLGTDDVHGIDIADLEEHKVIAEEKEEKIYEVVDQEPEFPGGQTGLSKYLSNTLVYPVVAQENNIQGRVIVRFVVNSQGKVSGIKILRGVDPALDKEAMRVVAAMPNWIPGKINGKAVNSYFMIPIVFVLNN